MVLLPQVECECKTVVPTLDARGRPRRFKPGHNAHGRPSRPLQERLWWRVNKTGTCWLWTDKPDSNGYGVIVLEDGRNYKVHRVVYELCVVPIPKGLEIDHLCRNRICVNPEHMEPVTTRVNIMRGNGIMAKEARQTHCKYGHPFDATNTIIHYTGGRSCLECHRTASREYAARRRASLKQVYDG